jgi:secondary thiamine-phosphate synthase enzyme
MEFTIKTSKQKDLIDITTEIASLVSKAGVKSGLCLVYVPHATAGLLVNEFEPNIKHDFEYIFDKLFPPDNYKHDKIDDNAAARDEKATQRSSGLKPKEAKGSESS